MKRAWILAAVTASISGSAIAIAAGVTAPITAAVADTTRPEADRARDADRKPADLIAFAGVKAGDSIAEIAPGGGYFTRILSNVVGPKGHVYALAGRPSPALTEFAASHSNVTVVTIQPGDVNPPKPVDVVWTTQNYHDFKNAKIGEGDAAATYNANAFKALKPGGIYLIGDHEAAVGAGATVTSTLHRIESAAVKKEVAAAGFKLVGESPLLRHTADDHSLKVQETGIRGKTDQFVLKFQKPKK